MRINNQESRDSKWQRKNRKRKRELDKKYYLENREKRLKYRKDKYKKDITKFKMYNHLSFLERKGIIKRNDFCNECNSKENLIKHHPDYSKPLEFITLCRNCHNKYHHNLLYQHTKSQNSEQAHNLHSGKHQSPRGDFIAKGENKTADRRTTKSKEDFGRIKFKKWIIFEKAGREQIPWILEVTEDMNENEIAECIEYQIYGDLK